MSNMAPPLMHGWLSKMGRHGLIKNWKKRYVTLIDGQLSYYVSAGKAPTWGVDLKGGLHLANTEITSTGAKNSKQIHIHSFNGDKDILLEAGSEAEVANWVKCIQKHITFADVGMASAADTISAKEVLAEVRVNSISARNRTTDDVKNTVSTARCTLKHIEEEDERNIREEDDSDHEGDGDDGDVILESKTRIEALLEYLMDALSTMSSLDSVKTTLLKVGGRMMGSSMAMLRSCHEEDKDSSPSSSTSSHFAGLSKAWGPVSSGRVVMLSILLLLLLLLLDWERMAPAFWLAVHLVVRTSGLVLVFLGTFFFGNAVYELREGMSIYPSAVRDSRIVTEGVYGLLSHPMYGGVLMLSTGYSLLANSCVRLVTCCVLALALNTLSVVEEEALTKEHPTYPQYALGKKKFVPFLC